MPLPIAVGGASLSSEQIRPPYRPLPSEALHDGANEDPKQHEQSKQTYQSVTWAVCPRNEWQARTVLSFYDESRTQQQQQDGGGSRSQRRKRRMVEIRIQISPLVSSGSPKNFRETRYHLELFPHEDEENEISSSSDSDESSSARSSSIFRHKHKHPQVLFSEDRKHLVVLLCHPDSQTNKTKAFQSSILVFQLRTPRTTSSDRSKIPLPSYIVSTKSGGSNSNSSQVANKRPTSPVVATHPKFVPCWGVTAICRLGGSNRETMASTNPDTNSTETNQQGTQQHHFSALPPFVFLAVRSDGTLMWVNMKSFQVIATASLPAPIGNLGCMKSYSDDDDEDDGGLQKSGTNNNQDRIETNLVVRSMQTSPTSTFEQGVLAIAVDSFSSSLSSLPSRSSSQSLESFVSEEDSLEEESCGDDFKDSDSTTNPRERLDIARGDCVLVEWSLRSTTLIQKTSLRRGSTGTISLPTDFVDQSEGLDGGDPSSVENGQTFQRAFQDMFDNLNKNKQIAAAEEEEEERLRRKEHMDQFVLEKLRTKRVSARSSASSDRLKAGPGTPQSLLKKGRYPRRRSSAEHEIGVGTGLDPTITRVQKAMRVSLLSVWSPPSSLFGTIGKEVSAGSDEIVVGDVCFGSVPSILCVVYLKSNRSSSSSVGPRQRVAQILTISKSTTFGDWDLVPTVSLYLSPEQVERSPDVADEITPTDDEEESKSSTMDDSTDTSFTRSSGNMGDTMDEIMSSQLVAIGYDSSSDSFMINSIFCGDKSISRWFGCVWNWRSNSVGWMIQKELSPLVSSQTTMDGMASGNQEIGNQEISSRIYCGRASCDGGGPYLVYMDSSLRCSELDRTAEQQSNTKFGFIETKKRMVPMGVLSPPNSVNPGVFAARSSLLVNGNHVSFPSVSRKDSDATMRDIDWRVSALPISYTMSHGCPIIAAIGPSMGKSIAVASTCGVCVLDTHHRSGNKWKQFGSPQEESSFSVRAMTWWEGWKNGRNDDEREDLLVAVTQTRNGEQFLSSWSSKRLDLMHQLLDTPDLEWKPGESQDPEPSWGIPLPKDIRVSNVSLLAEPEQDGSRDSPRKALAFVYSPDIGSSECGYLVFRLQVFRNKVSTLHSTPDPYVARRPFYVMAHTILRASLKQDRSLGPVTSIFIAGANFQFDLKPTKRKRSVSVNDNDEFLITLGVNHTPGGIHGLSVFKSGKTIIAPLSKFQVSKFQTSDLLLSGCVTTTQQMQVVSIVWNIELLNGEIISWSVPSFTAPPTVPLDTCKMDLSNLYSTCLKTADAKQPKGLRRPFNVCKNDGCRNQMEYLVLGRLCEVGSISDWAFQSTSGSQFDISLGLVPESAFGSVLRCGQNSQKFRRSQIGGVESKIFSSNILDMNTYSQSVFMITPPAFVTSLYALFLEEASICMDNMSDTSPTKLREKNDRLKLIESEIQRRLRPAAKTDVTIMALRLITFRTLETISKMHKRHLNDPSASTKSNLLLSQNLLSSVINATRRCTTILQFASLFLEVGRQTEPSNLQHLFPLSMPPKASETNQKLDRDNARTVVDLFTICIDQGSLAASASALPLLTSKDQARQYCGLLLDEAIDNFVQNTVSNQYNFDRTEEERIALGDFFRFGLNLEDADCFEEMLVADNREGTRSPYDSSDQSLASILPETPERTQRNIICNLNASSSILNYVVPSSLRGVSEQQRMEDAIRCEASSFIKHSLDDPALDFALLPDWDGSVGSEKSNAAEMNNIGALVGNAFLDLLQADQAVTNWKAISALSRMILKEGVEVPSSYDLFVEVANKSQPLDMLSIIPESYDLNNELEENLSAYIKKEINSCSRQLTNTDADLVRDMALLLIDRLHLLPLTDIDEQIAMELGLVFIAMVASDVGGHSQSIQDVMGQDRLLYKCYRQATCDVH